MQVSREFRLGSYSSLTIDHTDQADLGGIPKFQRGPDRSLVIAELLRSLPSTAASSVVDEFMESIVFAIVELILLSSIASSWSIILSA